MKKRGAIFWILVLIMFMGLAASGRILWKRVQYEHADRTVQVVVDFGSVLKLTPPKRRVCSVVDRIRSLGIEHFGLYEIKAEELLASDLMTIGHDPSSLRHHGMLVGFPEYLDGHKKYFRYLEEYFPGSGDPSALGFKKGTYIRIPGVGSDIEKATFGMVRFRSNAGEVPRFYNTPFENEKTIKLKMSELDSAGEPSVIVFDGESVLGYPGLLGLTAEEIARRPGWNFGMVEMVVQDGARSLAKMLPGRVLAVHSITEEELAKTPAPKAIDRYRRAARERGVRVLYVRLYTGFYGRSVDEALDENIEYLAALMDGLKKDGFETGVAVPLKPFVVSKYLRAMSVAGGVALVALMCFAGFGLPGWLGLASAAASFILCLAFPEGTAQNRMLVKLIALGLAVFVPAMSVTLSFLNGTPAGGERKFGAGMAVARWAAACALTLTGAVFVTSALSSREYFLRIEVFSGVKLAFVLPILLICVMYLLKTGEKISDFLDSPMRYAEVVLGIVVLGAIVIYVIRSGNEAAGAVTASEGSLRSALESLLLVRPRFKEFLIGHPALLALGIAPIGRKHYMSLVLCVFGVVGQVSILNTFCHFHTPLEISYTRVLLGMGIGVLFGLAARAATKTLFMKTRSKI